MSRFWICEKQTTGVLILVDIYNQVDVIILKILKVNAVVVWTLIETNSHPCNEYKKCKHQGLWNAGSVMSGTFQMWHILNRRLNTISPRPPATEWFHGIFVINLQV